MEGDTANRVIVFSGPTISRRDVESVIPATVRGPAKRGDVYLATLDQPWAIAIIDGYFDQTPAVWHKEILWALSLGIRVFGSSSMGALRAAELRSFGMEGIGAIYEAFASGELTADDEVAVAHGAETDGFRPLSDALVNIRWTLQAAERQGVLRRERRLSLEIAVQDLFYPDRSFDTLLDRGRRTGLHSEEILALERWLPTGKIDQKNADARQMLTILNESRKSAAPRARASFSFQHTSAWNLLRSTLDQLERRPVGGDRVAVDGATITALPIAVMNGATLRAIAVRDARMHRTRLAPGAVDLVVEEFRRERDLDDDVAFAGWIASNFANEAEVSEFFIEETLLRSLRASCEGAAGRHVKNELIAGVQPPLYLDSAVAPDRPAGPKTCDST